MDLSCCLATASVVVVVVTAVAAVTLVSLDEPRMCFSCSSSCLVSLVHRRNGCSTCFPLGAGGGAGGVFLVTCGNV